MPARLELDPSIAAPIKPIGLVDADGNVDLSFLQHPLASIKNALRNDAQRAAVLELLNSVLGSARPDPRSSPGARWHPLLDPDGRGNVHITVEGDVVGVALRMGTDPQQEPSEEIPREGAQAMRRELLARGSDGQLPAWRARSKQTGRGEGSSGLRYDTADPRPGDTG